MLVLALPALSLHLEPCRGAAPATFTLHSGIRAQGGNELAQSHLEEQVAFFAAIRGCSPGGGGPAWHRGTRFEHEPDTTPPALPRAQAQGQCPPVPLAYPQPAKARALRASRRSE